MTKDTATTLEDKRIRVMSPSGNIVLLPEREANDKSDPTSTMLASNNDENDDMDHHGKIRSGLMQRHVSLEYLNPVYECGTRKSAMAVAIINLVATTCGGGVLSLPLAFRRAGILPTTALMIYGVLATDFSLYILVSCARRTGGRSYGDVAKSSFGNLAEVLTSTLLGCMLIGSLTAYLVLVKDIWTPVVLSLLPMSVKQPLLLHHDTSTTTIRDDDMFDPTLRASKEGSSFILFLILILGSPLLLKRDLHALRHTCYVGFFSCALLMVAVVYRAYEAVRSNDPRRAPLNWYSTDIADYAFAFPIVVLCFFCSYNVLGVHASLLDPTRNRVKCVLDTSMFICVLLFYLVGLGGYLYALDETRDNILLNFPMNDSAVLLGRMGFCFTLLFGLPLVALPCREAFRAIPGQIRNWRIDAALAKEFKQVDQHRLHEGAHLVINGVDFDKADPTMVTEDPEKQHLTMMTYGATHEMEHVIGSRDEDEQTMASTSDADTGERSKLLDDEGSSDQSTFLDVEPIIHFVSTALVVGVCYSFAISVPGVGFVWSLAGSSMAILVAFIVPTACYLKIRQHKYVNPRSIAAWALLIISCIAAPICTRQALLNNGK